jgi:hypothetical protein
MYCSPSGSDIYKRDKTCFTRAALLRLVESWNSSNPTKQIRSYKNKNKKDLWNALNDRMSDICKGNDKEVCWVDALQGARPKREVAKSIRPAKPKSWLRNEYTWLTNIDIENVMQQYDISDKPSYKYKFLGVYPIDFEAKSMFGTCLFEEFCKLNIPDLYKQGVRYVGLITNLDKHDQNGSHWTSLFICIDHSLPSFGAYYYDSVASAPPDEISAFIHNVRKQVATMQGVNINKFVITYNRHRHQRGNTECGVFSMAYQLRWLRHLEMDPKNATFDKIVQDNHINDQTVHQLRNTLFRPPKTI